jgi:hypothetical protein
LYAENAERHATDAAKVTGYGVVTRAANVANDTSPEIQGRFEGNRVEHKADNISTQIQTGE